MISFHLTELKYLSSILERGLIGNVPRLSHHLDKFREDGLVGDKVVYTWKDVGKNFKYAKNMVYCNQWIKPRNDIVAKNDRVDYSKVKGIAFRNAEYVLLKITQSDIFNTYTHSQVDVGDPYDSLFGMDTEFEHDDKPLVIFTGKVQAKYIMPVELYYSEVEKGKLVVRSKPFIEASYSPV